MRSVLHPLFKKHFGKLTEEQQTLARKAFQTWQQDPDRVSWHLLHGMPNGRYYSASVGYGNRAIALMTEDDAGQPMACWIWIGSHEDYNKDLNTFRQRPEKTVRAGLSPRQRAPMVAPPSTLRAKLEARRAHKPSPSSKPASTPRPR